MVENSNFDVDSQLNLRFLYLLYMALDKQNGKEIVSSTVMNLVQFLLGNIHKFKNVLLMKESYAFEIPMGNKT